MTKKLHFITYLYEEVSGLLSQFKIFQGTPLSCSNQTRANMPAVAMLAIIIGLCDTIRPLLEMYNLQFLHFGSSTSDRVHHILYNDETQTGNYIKDEAEPSPMELFVNNFDDSNKHVAPKLKVPRAERSVAVVSKA